MHSSLTDKVKLLNYSHCYALKSTCTHAQQQTQIISTKCVAFSLCFQSHARSSYMYLCTSQQDFLIIRMIILMLIYKNRNVQYDLKHDVTLISSPSRMVGSFIVKAFMKCVVFNFTDSIQPYELLSIFSLVANLLQYICMILYSEGFDTSDVHKPVKM